MQIPKRAKRRLQNAGFYFHSAEYMEWLNGTEMDSEVFGLSHPEMHTRMEDEFHSEGGLSFAKELTCYVHNGQLCAVVTYNELCADVNDPAAVAAMFRKAYTS